MLTRHRSHYIVDTCVTFEPRRCIRRRVHGGRLLLLTTMGVLLLLNSNAHARDSAVEPRWRDDFRNLSQAGFSHIEEYADQAWRRFADRMGLHAPTHIVAYHGHGNDKHVWVQGRLLANTPVRGPRESDDWWDNLQATYERWETDEVPRAPIELRYAEQVQVVATDADGYYQARFPIDKQFPQSSVVIARYMDANTTLVAHHSLFLLSPGAKYLIVSDMDDTVIHTGITDLLQAARLTFLNNAKTRKPLPGVAALYRELAAAGNGENPIFYLSNSSWNMYDLLHDFLALNEIPSGPLMLRDIGLTDGDIGSSQHKHDVLRQLLDQYPDLPVILIGDSGQHDAAIYAQTANTFPGRVKAVYIRDVDPGQDSEYDVATDKVIEAAYGSGVVMLRGEDSRAFASHLRDIGVLDESQKAKIDASVKRDKHREKIFARPQLSSSPQ